MDDLADLWYNFLVYFTIVSLGGFLLGPLFSLVFGAPMWLLWFVWAILWLMVLLW